MERPVIDAHIHFGAPADEQSGCYWSEEFEHTAAYYVMLFLTHSLFRKINIARMQKHLLNVINSAKLVSHSIVLALDEVYDEQGNKHPEMTHLYVPNSYLIDLKKTNPRILLGASVHPHRQDWQDELDYCIENGAVLCKWIPSSQQIKPDHPTCMPFYKKLAQTGLPLLAHAGPEYAIPTSDKNYDIYNNPKYLRRALDEGVTVILAHCAMPYFGFLDVDYHDDFEDFLKLFKEAEHNGWNLYADLSAIATPLRAPYVEKVKQEISEHRLLFGSDYPIPASELSYNKVKGFFSWIKYVFRVWTTRNPLDKNYKIIRKMKFGKKVFTNGNRLFNITSAPG